jgi:hypothetical protein
MENVVPELTTDSTVIKPLWYLMMESLIANPRPMPPLSFFFIVVN